MMLIAYSGLGHVGGHMRKLVDDFALALSGQANAQEMKLLTGQPTPTSQRAATKPTKRATRGICLGC